jgi:hypothetical protein
VDVVTGTDPRLAEHGQRRPGQTEQSHFAGVRAQSRLNQRNFGLFERVGATAAEGLMTFIARAQIERGELGELLKRTSHIQEKDTEQ